MDDLSNVKALTFDLFGTVLDLGGSLMPSIETLLKEKDSDIDPQRFWEQWRFRQRLEQYQDTIMMLGHSGYLETARRAFSWTLKYFGVALTDSEIKAFMQNWQQLSPFPDITAGLEKLRSRYKLVALSNGEPHFLEHLAKNRVQWTFDEIISVEAFGFFKPHPAVYRGAAYRLNLEVWECMMVSSNPFDVAGARACGMRAAHVDRYGLPYEDIALYPDVTVKDFVEMADKIS